MAQRKFGSYQEAISWLTQQGAVYQPRRSGRSQHAYYSGVQQSWYRVTAGDSYIVEGPFAQCPTCSR